VSVGREFIIFYILFFFFKKKGAELRSKRIGRKTSRIFQGALPCPRGINGKNLQIKKERVGQRIGVWGAQGGRRKIGVYSGLVGKRPAL